MWQFLGCGTIHYKPVAPVAIGNGPVAACSKVEVFRFALNAENADPENGISAIHIKFQQNYFGIRCEFRTEAPTKLAFGNPYFPAAQLVALHASLRSKSR
jgi:hypothetical protein